MFIFDDRSKNLRQLSDINEPRETKRLADLKISIILRNWINIISKIVQITSYKLSVLNLYTRKYFNVSIHQFGY